MVRRRAPFAIAAGAILSLFASLVAPHAARACGPDEPSARFGLSDRPDFPYERYLDDRLGVVLRDFRTLDLVVAYRALSGASLPRDTRASLLRFPDRGWWLWTPVDRVVDPSAAADTNWSLAWSQARALALRGGGSGDYVYPNRELEGGAGVYDYYANCLRDAFRSATATLRARLQSEGGLTPALHDWLDAQDVVFGNCDGHGAPLLPEPAPDSSPEWLVKARDYQRAAAWFYGADFERAESAFRAIGQDARSPYRGLGRYLATRAILRRATLAPGEGAVDAAELARADRELREMRADARLADLHPAIDRLIGFATYRIDRTRRLEELCAALSAARPSSTFASDVIDLAKLLMLTSAETVDSLAAAGRHVELAQWIKAMRSAGDSTELARWRATGSELWLVAAISSVGGSEPAALELMAAANRVPRSSPAYATVTFQRLRLHVDRDERGLARALVDAILEGDPAPWNPTALNAVHGWAVDLARDERELLAQLPRVVVAETTMSEGDTPASSAGGAGREDLDLDGAELLSSAPIATLVRLAEGTALPLRLRRELALVAWTRAAALQDDALARRALPAFARLWPTVDSHLSGVKSARTPRDRSFAATLFLLRHSGTSITVESAYGLDQRGADLNAGRWGYVSQLSLVAPSSRRDSTLLRWLGDAAHAAGRREFERLKASGPFANRACRIVLAYAAAKPADPRLPEALARCVRATHWGERDDATTSWSRRAFQALHRRYGKTTWAAQTKVYY